MPCTVEMLLTRSSLVMQTRNPSASYDATLGRTGVPPGSGGTPVAGESADEVEAADEQDRTGAAVVDGELVQLGGVAQGGAETEDRQPVRLPVHDRSPR